MNENIQPRQDQLDDVEGHQVGSGRAVPQETTEDDVDGHALRVKGLQRESTENDVEGHMPVKRGALPAEEDVEGHGRRFGALPADDDEGDDTEGHVLRGRG